MLLLWQPVRWLNNVAQCKKSQVLFEHLPKTVLCFARNLIWIRFQTSSLYAVRVYTVFACESKMFLADCVFTVKLSVCSCPFSFLHVKLISPWWTFQDHQATDVRRLRRRWTSSGMGGSLRPASGSLLHRPHQQWAILFSHPFTFIRAQLTSALSPTLPFRPPSSCRNHPDWEPAHPVAAGAGAHAEGVPGGGSGGPEGQEGDVSGQAAATGAGSAGDVALPRALWGQPLHRQQ